jgi:hypothetical protein
VWEKVQKEGALVEQGVYGKKDGKEKKLLRTFKELN